MKNSARGAAPAFVLFLCLAAGCGDRLPPPTDAGAAREALVAALDAWKEGRSAATLRDRTPPIDFRDVQQEKGGRLVRYEVTDVAPSGLSVRFTVRLTFDRKGGQGGERVATYDVDGGATFVIRPTF